jgi:hypothetical protein
MRDRFQRGSLDCSAHYFALLCPARLGISVRGLLTLCACHAQSRKLVMKPNTIHEITRNVTKPGPLFELFRGGSWIAFLLPSRS